MTITEGTIEANGLTFGYLEAGEGPLALCLHGFPDSAHTFRPMLAALAGAGWRAVTPFQRGYAPSAVPADGRYQTGVLALDANALHEHLGGDAEAVIVGHDWGAMAATGAAVAAPERWARVVTMAVPPGPAAGVALLDDLRQTKRSWYMFLFQHPFAEHIVANHDLAMIDLLWEDWSPGHRAGEQVRAAKACLTDPANLAAALGYYRATLGDGYRDPALEAIHNGCFAFPAQPVLHVHGADDGCIGAEVAAAMAAAAPGNVRTEIVDGAGHFLHVEQPAAVNRLVLDHLARR